jgi:ribosomal protein S18 acetylase RimI-like enzyme
MLPILNIVSLQKEIQKIQGGVSRSSIQTNYFDQNLLSSTFKVVKTSNSLVFVDKTSDASIGRLFYFFLGNSIDFDFDFDFDLVCDVLAKTPLNEQLINFFNINGFKAYAQLKKMSMINSPLDHQKEACDITIAKNKDISSLSILFEKNFDKFSERPPSIGEIESAIKNEEIYCKFDNFGNILGFYWNRNMKFLSELRYLFVINNCRGLGIGKELLSSYLFNTSKINRKQLWVLEDNPSAINLYMKYGYRFDGLVDYIFIRKNNQ